MKTQTHKISRGKGAETKQFFESFIEFFEGGIKLDCNVIIGTDDDGQTWSLFCEYPEWKHSYCMFVEGMLYAFERMAAQNAVRECEQLKADIRRITAHLETMEERK